MNATSLYIFSCRLMLQADAADKSTWSDLYRLLPYLRQSLSCTVCGNILKEPYTPEDTGCQHHVCRNCVGGRKKLKPTCNSCKEYESYTENVQLRLLIQCYKKLCDYLINTDIYRILLEQDEGTSSSSSLADLIQEAATFNDDYKSVENDFKSAYSMLPCVYNNSSNAGSSSSSSGGSSKESPPLRTAISNGGSLYSVMFAGSGNKITIKRKPPEGETSSNNAASPKQSSSTSSQQTSFKKPASKSRSQNKRKGCRCGNATATPGKLTCCGQRCPCYVESKPCTECKCKGCRNPHRADGMKVRPHIIADVTGNILTIEPKTEGNTSPCPSTIDDSETLAVETNINYNTSDINTSIYTNQLQEVSASLPEAIMMDEDENYSSPTQDASPQTDMSPSSQVSPKNQLSDASITDSQYTMHDNMSDLDVDE